MIMKSGNVYLRGKSYLIMLATVVSFFSLASAQEIWDRPYTQWTKNDVQRISTNSPWAKTFEDRTILGYGNPPISTKIIVRLRSSLTIRQAIVRYNQLEAKYDRMSDTERAAFDAKTKGLLLCPACAQNYVITISSPIARGPGDDVAGELKNDSLATLKSYVYIENERGERRELINFVPPRLVGDEALFFFPRSDEGGHVLITPTNKKLRFYVQPRAVSNFSPLFGKIEFDVQPLVINGEVDF